MAGPNDPNSIHSAFGVESMTEYRRQLLGIREEISTQEAIDPSQNDNPQESAFRAALQAVDATKGEQLQEPKVFRPGFAGALGATLQTATGSDRTAVQRLGQKVERTARESRQVKQQNIELREARRKERQAIALRLGEAEAQDTDRHKKDLEALRLREDQTLEKMGQEIDRIRDHELRKAAEARLQSMVNARQAESEISANEQKVFDGWTAGTQGLSAEAIQALPDSIGTVASEGFTQFETGPDGQPLIDPKTGVQRIKRHIPPVNDMASLDFAVKEYEAMLREQIGPVSENMRPSLESWMTQQVNSFEMRGLRHLDSVDPGLVEVVTDAEDGIKAPPGVDRNAQGLKAWYELRDVRLREHKGMISNIMRTNLGSEAPPSLVAKAYATSLDGSGSLTGADLTQEETNYFRTITQNDIGIGIAPGDPKSVIDKFLKEERRKRGGDRAIGDIPEGRNIFRGRNAVIDEVNEIGDRYGFESIGKDRYLTFNVKNLKGYESFKKPTQAEAFEHGQLLLAPGASLKAKQDVAALAATADEMLGQISDTLHGNRPARLSGQPGQGVGFDAGGLTFLERLQQNADSLTTQ